jgi:hypothetical protein
MKQINQLIILVKIIIFLGLDWMSSHINIKMAGQRKSAPELS